MKVFGGILRIGGAEVRVVFAGTRGRLAKAVGLSVSTTRKWWAETNNALEKSVAEANPGKLMYTPNNFMAKSGDDFKEYKR